MYEPAVSELHGEHSLYSVLFLTVFCGMEDGFHFWVKPYILS